MSAYYLAIYLQLQVLLTKVIALQQQLLALESAQSSTPIVDQSIGAPVIATLFDVPSTSVIVSETSTTVLFAPRQLFDIIAWDIEHDDRSEMITCDLGNGQGLVNRTIAGWQYQNAMGYLNTANLNNCSQN